MTIYNGSYATITTRYFGPTNTRGAKIVAKCQAGRASIPYPHEARHEEVHILAVRALLQKLKLDWGPDFVIGTLDKGYVFTPVKKRNLITIDIK